MSHLEALDVEFQRFQIQLPETEKLSLAMYCDELIRWNTKMNLTALSGPNLVRRLVAEPVWIAQELMMRGSLVDIGSGNGSPAIPFLLSGSLTACDLIEARAKKAAFLRHMATTLKRPNIRVHRARFEDVGATLKPPDWVSLQAVALTDRLMRGFGRIAGTTTTIVWITSEEARSKLKPFRILTVPITGTQVFLFRLDLS